MSGNFEVVPCGTLQRLAEVEVERDSMREILDHIPQVEAELEETSDRLHAVEAERDALRSLINNVLRCRYPVCTTICSSGYGWDIPRLNEVIDAAIGGGNG